MLERADINTELIIEKARNVVELENKVKGWERYDKVLKCLILPTFLASIVVFEQMPVVGVVGMLAIGGAAAYPDFNEKKIKELRVEIVKMSNNLRHLLSK